MHGSIAGAVGEAVSGGVRYGVDMLKGKLVNPNKGGSGDLKGNKEPYIPRDADGNPIPLAKQRVNGQDIPLPDSNAQGPHTVLGGKISSETGLPYRQSATFPEGTWPTANGQNVPWSEIHWGDHGKPAYHVNPHQHQFIYDFVQRKWMRQGPTNFNY
ncbi:hypothetical protein [Robinsoniella sp. KNHs210]|uniref:hypothetical protein n=1 Tax=Robinsoniella sp. KNHs210 TaxID=1469950 RepID=UPI00048751D5|nr:hypothetical protein [Robinsoniella sp. KNHs210]